jgi:uncharacterized protein involved in tolerance to divalent cations
MATLAIEQKTISKAISLLEPDLLNLITRYHTYTRPNIVIIDNLELCLF